MLQNKIPHCWPLEAVASVIYRGFYKETPRVTGNRVLMAQCLRLTEEVGEFFVSNTLEELADVLIVAAQIMNLAVGPDDALDLVIPDSGERPAYRSQREMDALKHEIVAACGSLARCLRKNDTEGVRAALIAISTSAHAFARDPFFEEQYPDRLEQIIVDKLTADEARGHLHGEAV